MSKHPRRSARLHGGQRRRYGEWALITGASSGIGEAFAHAVAADGMRPILLARREDELRRVAADIFEEHGVLAECVVADLSDPDFVGQVRDACMTKEVGLVISNAALNPAGRFLHVAPEVHQRMLDVNCRATVTLADMFLPDLAARGRGGFVIVASMEGFFGMPFSAVYSATKSFAIALGEALWAEFREAGVDVVVVAPGATDTPLLASREVRVAAMAPRAVAEAALAGLGGGPLVVPGLQNRVATVALRLLPRHWSVRLAGTAMKKIVERS